MKFNITPTTSVIVILSIAIFCSQVLNSEAQYEKFEKFVDFDGDLYAEEAHSPKYLQIRKSQLKSNNFEKQPIYIQNSVRNIPIESAAVTNNNAGESVADREQLRVFGAIARTKKLLLLKFKKLLPAGLLTLPILLRTADGIEIPINSLDDLEIIEVPDVPAATGKSVLAGNGKSSSPSRVNKNPVAKRFQKVFVLDKIEFPQSIDFQQSDALAGRSLKPGESRFVSVLTTQKRKVSA